MYGFDWEPGITLLEVPSPRSTVVHRVVAGRLADSDRPATAYWIDARNAASTHALYECAPSRRALAGLSVARAFTAYQHHSLVRETVRRADPETDLLVAPNAAALYRDSDLAAWEREDLLAATLETLSHLGRALECPVLVTSARGEDAETIGAYAERTVECVRTREGVRLEREDGEAITDGYWHGAYWQTTIPYWAEICGTVDRLDPVAAADLGLFEVTA